MNLTEYYLMVGNRAIDFCDYGHLNQRIKMWFLSDPRIQAIDVVARQVKSEFYKTYNRREHNW